MHPVHVNQYVDSLRRRQRSDDSEIGRLQVKCRSDLLWRWSMLERVLGQRPIGQAASQHACIGSCEPGSGPLHRAKGLAVQLL